MALVERRDVGAVAVVEMNRPERRNALAGALVEALASTLGAAAEDDAVNAIVLTGRGTVFCAGGDLAEGLAGDGFVASHDQRGQYADLLALIPRLRVPVVAAVNGDALGGGLGLAAACDVVVADARARLGTPEVRVGLFPWIILAVLQRDVPRKPLMELVLTGGRWSAEEAQQLGLVNRVAEEGTAVDTAVALATVIAARSPAVIAWGKAAFYRISDQGYDDALAYMHAQLSLNLLTEDAMEGVAAFLQKREPRWTGR
ncbi:MAG: enoyl-CoA hydratase/carnithine racemase [Myxococcota bacterium]|jgi:enoyl-CoA hydratase/carnithine racemase